MIQLFWSLDQNYLVCSTTDYQKDLLLPTHRIPVLCRTFVTPSVYILPASLQNAGGGGPTPRRKGIFSWLQPHHGLHGIHLDKILYTCSFSPATSVVSRKPLSYGPAGNSSIVTLLSSSGLHSTTPNLPTPSDHPRSFARTILPQSKKKKRIN